MVIEIKYKTNRY